MDRVKMNYATHVKGVTKTYRLYDRLIDRLKKSLYPLHKEYHKRFYTLNSISFDVKKGETMGIIGTNGSGRSTILKVITDVLSPTTGEVEVVGTMSALLGLGVGFNMGYTGTENIYMNGTMMGFLRKGMDEKLQDTLGFADIGDPVYQPMKTYSGGMFARLVFALAIDAELEILIVDEAPSVGDVSLQFKYYRRMEETCEKGTTTLIVTHDMGSIIKHCDKVMLLNQSSFMAEEGVGHTVDLYKKILANQMDTLNEELEGMNDLSGEEERKTSPARKSEAGLIGDKLTINSNHTEYGDGRVGTYDLGLSNEGGSPADLLLKGESLTIREGIRFHTTIQSPIFTYTIGDKKGMNLIGTNTVFERTEAKPVKAGDKYEVSFTQKTTLQDGEYLLSMSCTGSEQGGHVVYHRLYDMVNIMVISSKNTAGVYDMGSQVETKYVRVQADGTVRHQW